MQLQEKDGDNKCGLKCEIFKHDKITYKQNRFYNNLIQSNLVLNEVRSQERFNILFNLI